MPTPETRAPLKIYTDNLLAEQSHTHILIPFWGKPEAPGEGPVSGMFEKFRLQGHRSFRLTPLNECDLVVFPCGWFKDRVGEAIRMAEQARSVGRKLAIFFESDSDEDISVPNSVVFRNSLYRSKKSPTEFSNGAWCVDFLERYLHNQPAVRHKNPKATVSFCGQCPDPSGARPRAITRLIEQKHVNFNFLLRSKFWAGTHDPEGRLTPLSVVAREQYVQNMIDGDYVLCVRGIGNFSYRLSETLSCGRIPVFVDTDCVLPYDFTVDWKQYCVWIERRDIDRIGEIVAEFHSHISPGQFIELQMACRRLWEQWLSPEGYFANFYRHFPELS